MKNLLFGASTTSSTFTDFFLLVARVIVGLSMAFAHGYGKIPPADRFIEGLGEMGFPQPMAFAWMAALAEFAGGLCLAAGLFTRPAAFFIGFTMSVAAFVKHVDDPFNKQELSLLYFAFALVFIALGGGRFSLDRFFRKG